MEKGGYRNTSPLEMNLYNKSSKKQRGFYCLCPNTLCGRNGLPLFLLCNFKCRLLKSLKRIEIRARTRGWTRILIGRVSRLPQGLYELRVTEDVSEPCSRSLQVRERGVASLLFPSIPFRSRGVQRLLEID